LWPHPIKEFVLGRKNYLFFGSPDAAKYSAIIMSMLSSARRHGLDEWAYLTHVLNRLADLSSLAELRELLPNRWRKLPENTVTLLTTRHEQAVSTSHNAALSIRH
jgi:hypothetical protein